MIGGVLTYQQHEAATAAAKAADILQQQEKEDPERKAEDEAFRRRVEPENKRHGSDAAQEGKTWQTYIP